MRLSEEALEEMRQVFEKSIEMAYAVFQERAFRRFYSGNTYNPNGSWEKSRLNVALWDTILYTFSYYELDEVLPIKDHIREEFLDMLTYDKKFVEYISTSTDKADRIQYRADTWRDRLQKLVGLQTDAPLTFSLAFKQSLLEKHPTCHVCWKPIEHVDDAVIAHISDYWRENKQIPENARLDHRFCHRERTN
ncbi:MAG: HNH endonuclease [Leptolyngbya sp. SIO1D8]|nr:HNH endonuclease [Leptolyngbya sp. SIO1D8]